MRRALLVAAAAASLALGPGCCHSFRSFVYSPFGPGTLCDPTYCGDCGDCGGCGRCGRVATHVERGCDVGCGSGCTSCGGCGMDCGAACYDPCAYPVGPLTLVFSIFNPEHWDGGCGERYWGDFHGDPPHCCDPCDHMGNYTGGGCGCSSTVEGVVSTSEPIMVSQTDRVVSPARATRTVRGVAPIPDPGASRRAATQVRR